MKKIFVSLMLAGAILAGGTAFAQTQTDGTTGATTQQSSCCQTDAKATKGDKGNKGAKDFRGNKGPRGQFNPFDGVQLTPDQQQKLQVLQQGLGPVRLSKSQEDSIPVNPNLSPEERKQLNAQKMATLQAQKLEQKKNYLNGVKEVLTPDQYVIFLENVYLYSPQDNGRGGQFGPSPMRHKAGKGAPDHKVKGEKKDKGDK